MCGIAGLLELDGAPASASLTQRMIDMVRHRGPDGDAVWTENSVGLGHRRLAIIDLSPGGVQPMTSANGRYVITYNGELYNFRELRKELEAIGHTFRTRSDTEVLLAAFVQWNTEAFVRFNGMFALAIYDREERSLLLARDRFGVKPLYFAHAGSTFLFGSEIKALLGNPKLKAEIDPAALVEYLTFQNFFTEKTLFRGCQLLPAGTWMRIAANGATQAARYWDFAFSEPATARSEAAYLDDLDQLFRQAVRNQLVADVPVQSYLSGGMDSGSITAVAASQMKDLRTFTIGFDLSSASGMELGFDERSRAEFMSARFKTEHYEMVLKAGDMERVMPEVVYHVEEPRVGQCYPNYFAAKLAGKFGKVVLSGAGGDELFAGYPWRYYRAAQNGNFDQYIDKYLGFWQRLLNEDQLKNLLAPIAKDVSRVSTRDIFRNVFANHASELTRPEDYINHSLYFEAKTFLNGLLVVEDKLSMAHGLETRVPFLDNDLVNFAQTVPVGMKLGNLGAVSRLNENDVGGKSNKFFQQNRDGKLILRRTMERFIPKAVTTEIKQGFSGPDASWFRGESIDFVRKTLFNDSAYIYDWMDKGVVKQLVSEHLEGRQNRRLLIWSLLYLEEWAKQFLHSGSLSPRSVA
ncbi:MAG TPA: asparagine synthase (glutamine-hydrolyzing) [Chthoniobacterales bacterium]